MAKFHIALYRLSVAGSSVLPVPDMEAVASEVIDTATSKLSTIYPKEKNLFWVVTALSATGGWVKLGATGNATAAPAPAPQSEQGNPVVGNSEKSWKAPAFRRIGIEPMA